MPEGFASQSRRDLKVNRAQWHDSGVEALGGKLSKGVLPYAAVMTLGRIGVNDMPHAGLRVHERETEMGPTTRGVFAAKYPGFESASLSRSECDAVLSSPPW